MFLLGGDEMRRSDPAGDGPGGEDTGAGHDAVERWIQEGLEQLYSEVLDEPLPPEMAELLQRYERRLRDDKNGEKVESGDDADES